MREAGVNLVTVGVFSWALLEPRAGRVRVRLARRGARPAARATASRVDLATATASPPPWLSARYPETLPADADGTVLWPGGRQAWCPSSPVFREQGARACGAAGEPLPRPPGAGAVARVQRARLPRQPLLLRRLCRRRSGSWLRGATATSTTLNDAWGTAFWSQRYGVVRRGPAAADRTDVRQPHAAAGLRRGSAPTRCSTTSGPSATCCTGSPRRRRSRRTSWSCRSSASWTTGLGPRAGRRLQRPLPHGRRPGPPRRPRVLCRPHPRAGRRVARGCSWSTRRSAVNWQPRNLAKAPGQMRRNSLQHVARGADGVCFFQWRASRAGAEKFHSAPGAARRHRHQGLARGRRARRDAGSARRGGRQHGVVPTSRSCSTRRRGGPVELDSHPSVDVPTASAHRALLPRAVGCRRAPSTSWRRDGRPVGVPAGLSSRRSTLSTDAAAAGDDRRTSGPAGTLLVTYCPASSTSTTTSGSAATRARSATCSACGSRSSSRCARASRCRLDGRRRDADVWTEHVHLRRC